jgi:hypothetical protein
MDQPSHNVDPEEADTAEGEVGPAGTIRFREIAPALEFACWVVVALAPLLRWVNGPAVTDDQFYFQCAIVASAVAGAAGLRLYNWRTGQSQRE